MTLLATGPAIEVDTEKERSGYGGSPQQDTAVQLGKEEVMANIYEEKTEGLSDLLDRAAAMTVLPVLIPNLQRPYCGRPTRYRCC